MNSTQELQNILSGLGFTSIEDAASQQAKLVLYSKISKYQAEDNFFRNKYKSDFVSFSKKIETSITENFEETDDLMDWEFVVDALKILQKDIEFLEK